MKDRPNIAAMTAAPRARVLGVGRYLENFSLIQFRHGKCGLSTGKISVGVEVGAISFGSGTRRSRSLASLREMHPGSAG